MTHIKYPKIYRLGHEDTDGILLGTCYIEEKIDGANVSIWLEDGELKCGSRTRDLGEDSFNGFVPYAKAHPGIRDLLRDHPDYRLYGEWLVRHTIQYDETAYRQFYLFDIFIGDAEDRERLSWDMVRDAAEKYSILQPQLFEVIENPTVEQIEKYVGLTNIGKKGEGVVIKNYGFTNKFGHKQYAKVVTEKFKEDNAITFGGNNKHSDTYREMWVVNKFMSLARVEKVMNKLQPEIDKRLDMEHTARIINTAYHDLITEEVWTIQKKFEAINFKTLARLCQRKAAQIYHDLLNNSISIADEDSI